MTDQEWYAVKQIIRVLDQQDDILVEQFFNHLEEPEDRISIKDWINRKGR